MSALSLPTRRAALILAGVLLSTAPLVAQTTAPTVEKTVQVGRGLYELAANPSNGLLYVASTGAENVKVFGLDARTLEVKSTIDVASAPAYGLGINVRTQTLYSTNTRVGNVSAIDLRTGKIVATIADPLEPRAHLFRVLVDEETNTIYTSVTGGRIWIIDGATNTMRGIVENVGRTTVGLALDRAANRLYATNLGDNEVVAIDLATRRVVGRYATGGERSTILAMDVAGKRLFVTNQTTGDVSILDAADGKLIQTVKTGAGALGVVYHPTENRIYVANRGEQTVTVIDGASYGVISQLAVKGYPNTLTLDPTTGAVFVTSKARAANAEGEEPVGDTVSRIVVRGATP